MVTKGLNYFENSSITDTNSVYNACSVLSGGVYYFTINLYDKNFILTNASFTNNDCGSRGGSIVGQLFNSSYSEITIKDSTFINNTAHT